MRSIARSARDEDGAAGVEFALVSVVLVLLIVGILQFGLSLWQWLEITHAAREGARWAALRDHTAAQKAVTAALPLVVAPANVTIDPPDYATNAACVGYPVTVTVRYDSTIIAPLMERFVHSTGAFTLRSSATQRVE